MSTILVVLALGVCVVGIIGAASRMPRGLGPLTFVGLLLIVAVLVMVAVAKDEPMSEMGGGGTTDSSVTYDNLQAQNYTNDYSFLDMLRDIVSGKGASQ
jgi:hypothetical protein